MLHIRSYAPEDADALGQVFYAAVHDGAASDYSEAQRQAWCLQAPSGPEWEARLARADCVVAEWDGALEGFMTLVLDTGLIDLAFVAPALHRRGIASKLLAVLEGRARCAGVTELKTEASLLAEPMFAASGWDVVERQAIKRFEVTLQNARMEKVLS